MNPKGEMKGSAITGPVAKECVRARIFFFFYAPKLTCLATGGLVAAYRIERRHGGLRLQHSPSFAARFMMSCISKCVYNLHAHTTANPISIGSRLSMTSGKKVHRHSCKYINRYTQVFVQEKCPCVRLMEQ